MIAKGCIMQVLDNSGAKTVRYFGNNKIGRRIRIGDVIKVSIITKSSQSSLSGIQNAVVCSLKTPVARKDASYSFVKFSRIGVILVNDKMELLGSRILNVIGTEVRKVNENAVSLAKSRY